MIHGAFKMTRREWMMKTLDGDAGNDTQVPGDGNDDEVPAMWSQERGLG